MIGRTPALTALALVALALAAMTATHGLPFGKAETYRTACSSCDARHQNHMRLVTQRKAETTP